MTCPSLLTEASGRIQGGEKIIRVFGLLNYPWLRSGSRINTDLFPLGNFLEFDSSKSLFLGFWVIHTSHFPDFKLKSFFFNQKFIYYTKNLTDFRKAVESGVDPRLWLLVLITNLLWPSSILHCGLLTLYYRPLRSWKKNLIDFLNMIFVSFWTRQWWIKHHARNVNTVALWLTRDMTTGKIWKKVKESISWSVASVLNCDLVFLPYLKILCRVCFP